MVGVNVVKKCAIQLIEEGGGGVSIVIITGSKDKFFTGVHACAN